MDYKIILLASFGAFVQELIHWYGIRRKLEMKQYKKTMRSLPYWIITLLMIIVSGFGTFFWYEKATELSLFHYVVTGAAFPLLFKKIVQSFTDNQPRLGRSDGNSISLIIKRYFETA